MGPPKRVMFEASVYEIAANLVLGPFGGLHALRANVLDSCALQPGARVLEVGCGPGRLTRKFLARGANVTAIDASALMLKAARRHAPTATYVQADACAFMPPDRFDAVVLSFILHELPVSDLPAIVGRFAEALSSDGRIVVADHAAPSGLHGRTWRAVLRTIETSTIETWLGVDTSTLLQSAGLCVCDDRWLARGRARLTIASRPHESAGACPPTHQRTAS